MILENQTAESNNPPEDIILSTTPKIKDEAEPQCPVSTESSQPKRKKSILGC